jgi:hypothetical protein
MTANAYKAAHSCNAKSVSSVGDLIMVSTRWARGGTVLKDLTHYSTSRKFTLYPIQLNSGRISAAEKKILPVVHTVFGDSAGRILFW